jgi:diguanylate cyclase (GGDEF)-like protein/PAS domain S-box-containing protein
MGQVPAEGVSQVPADELEQICAHNLLRSADEIIYFKDLQSRFIWLSKAWGTVSGRDPEKLLGLTDFDIYTDEHASVAYADEQRIIATGIPIVDKQEHETWPDRPDRWVSATKHPLRDLDGRIIGTFGISRDITRLVNAEQQAIRIAADLADAHVELGRVESQLRAVLDTSSDAIALYDQHLRYQYVNAAAERMLGAASSELIGRTDREFGREEALLAVWEAGLNSVLATGEGCSVDLSVGSGADWRGFQSHMAARREGDHGPPIGVVASTREVTELKRAQDKLAHLALHDPVTGLANRVLLMDRLTRALIRMSRHSGQIALLFIDLDHFKSVNDVYGHGTGDRLLTEVGRRLTAITRQGDTVARFGGDEFVLLCEELRTERDVRAMAARVVGSLFEPFIDKGRKLHVTGSVGVVVSRDPYAVAEELIRDADAAMYQAKERGRNHFQFFDADLRDRAAAKYTVEKGLLSALELHQFRLEYQPLFSLGDRHIVGVEALIRWDHPERGPISPAEFIGVAETRGLIVPIGTWVLGEACRQMAEWSALRPPELPPLTIAVNVSSRQLRTPHLADVVKEALVRYGLGPAQLCLEITETALLEDTANTRGALEELSALNVRVALDDFGTGYSSLAHLLHFPVDILKIDRTFVDRLESNDRERKIVAAVTAMAHVLGMKVIGEGIETAGQLRQLADLGCDEGQGYHLARPMRPSALTELLRLELSDRVM